MKKIPVHKALRVGMAIYILCLSIGICFLVQERVTVKIAPNIISQLTLEEDADSDNDESKSKKRFGSRFMAEEDDDDSAKNFFADINISRENQGFVLREPSSAYLTNPRNIPTPPPWS